MARSAQARPSSEHSSAVPDKLHVVCPGCLAVNRLARSRLDDAPACGKCREALFRGLPVALNAAAFERQIGRSDIPVVVDFWAPWCGPCLSMAPEFERAAAELEPRYRLAKVDTEAEPAIGARLDIRSIPTLIEFRGGKAVARHAGALRASDIVRWVGSNA